MEQPQHNPKSVPEAPPPATPSGPANGQAPAPQRVELPAAQEDRLRIWGLMVLCLLAVLPAMLVGLHDADVTDPTEAAALAISQETWLRNRGVHPPLLPADQWQWLIPSLRGQPALDTPPLTIWINTLAWLSLEPDQTSPQQLVFYARLVAVGMSMLTLLATFWAGLSVGNLRTAGMAMVVAGGGLLFVQQMRLAAYDTHLATFVTLAIAAGLWAMRPLKPTNWTQRRVIGWLIAGLAMAAAFMTRGFLAAPLMLVPLIAAICITPRRRVGNAIGLVFALLLGVLGTAPWLTYVIHQAENLHFATADAAFAEVFSQYVLAAGGPGEATPRWMGLWIWVGALPWTVWLIGGLFQPWMRAQGERRRVLLIGWLWLLGGWALLMGMGTVAMRDLVALVPAAGLVAGQLWSWHIDLASKGQRDTGSWILWTSHWTLLIVISIALPLFVFMQDYLMARGSLEQYALPGLPMGVVVAWGAALLIVALEGLRLHWRWHPRSAAVATVLWAMVLFTVSQWSLVRSHHARNLLRLEAAKLAGAMDGVAVYELHPTRPQRTADHAALDLYSRLMIRPLAMGAKTHGMRTLGELAAAGERAGILTRPTPAAQAALREAGFVLGGELADGRWELYALPAGAP